MRRQRRAQAGHPIGEHHASDAVVASDAVLHQRRRFLLGCVLACVAAGCSGNSVTTTTAPTPVKCTTNVSGLPASVPATGTKVQATLSAARECSWTATSEAAWLALMPRKRGADTGSQLRSPMPAVVVAISAEVGQSVAAGDPLCVVEAMKMEITLGAERSGVVSKVHVGRGDALALDAVIIEFE